MVRIRDLLRLFTYLCVAAGYASVFSYVNVYFSLSFGCLSVVSIYRDYSTAFTIPRWVLNVVSVLVLALIPFRISAEFLIEPILDALAILTGIKLLEDKQFRDYMQIYAMSMFLLVGSSFISMSIAFIVFFLALVVLLTVSLMLLACYSQDPEMVIERRSAFKILQQGLLICAIAIPASAIFFIVLPRTNYPLLSFLNKTGLHRSGFSDTVSLGTVSEIQEDDSVIFRANMGEVDFSNLYWRGVVLDSFDGLSWKSSTDSFEMKGSAAEEPATVVTQTIYLEPYGNKYLFALDHPVSVIVHRPGSGPMSYFPKDNINQRIRYTVKSVPSAFWQEQRSEDGRYLQVPPDFSPKIRELVRSLAEGKGEGEVMAGLFRFMRFGQFQYSLESLPVSSMPLEDFLFTHKRGNCEYFASSLAVMLRIAGIPARLVGGYRGGYYNRAGRYYMVLQRNAHVWVEAYSANHGWLRLDPTPALSNTALSGYGTQLLMQIRVLLDTFNYYWSKFVVNYDLSRQMKMLHSIRSAMQRADFDFSDWNMSHLRYIPLLLLVVAAPGLFVLARFYRRGSVEARLLAKFFKRMSRYGYEKRRSEGLEEFVQRIEGQDLRAAAAQFVADFQVIYYKDLRFDREEIRRLETVIEAL